MGADLYLTGFGENKKKYQSLLDEALTKRDEARMAGNTQEAEHWKKEIERLNDLIYGEYYFCDSYNSSSVACAMGISWWRDIVPLLNENSNLCGEKLEAVIAMVEEKQISPAVELKLENCVDADTTEGRERWRQYFVEERERLLTFLKNGRKNSTGIMCSL